MRSIVILLLVISSCSSKNQYSIDYVRSELFKKYSDYILNGLYIQQGKNSLSVSSNQMKLEDYIFDKNNYLIFYRFFHPYDKKRPFGSLEYFDTGIKMKGQTFFMYSDFGQKDTISIDTISLDFYAASPIDFNSKISYYAKDNKDNWEFVKQIEGSSIGEEIFYVANEGLNELMFIHTLDLKKEIISSDTILKTYFKP